MDAPTPEPTPPGESADQMAPPPLVNEARPSKKALWLAMSSVTLAIALVWFAPGLDDHSGGKARLDFTLKDMHGVDVRLDSFEGKVLVINFWATWCLPCKAEIPDLVALQAKYQDDLVVLGISVDDTAEQIKPYAIQYKVNYRMLVGNKREDVQEALGPLMAVPVSVIVDRDGNIAVKHTGIATREQLETEIKALL
jgi:thiol-disulfide isomerase/thioredoxin